MAEPTLNEITSIKGDGNLAYGTQGQGGTDVELAFGKGIELLYGAAQMKQQNDRWKYQQFQQNLDNYYKNFNDISVDGVMEKDYPEVMADYSSLAKKMAENIGVIRNPASNPDLYAQLKQEEANLRGKISQSKQDVVYRTQHKNFIMAHPEFNTDENKKAIESFENSTRNERELFTLNTPYTFNVEEPVKLATSIALQKSKEEAVKRGVAPDKTEEWIVSEEGINYNRQAFKDAYKEYITNQRDRNNTGKTLRDVAQSTWSKLPKESQLGSFDEWLDKTSESFIPQSSYFQTIQESKYGLQEEQIEAQKDLNAADNAMRWRIAKLNDGTERWRAGLQFNFRDDKDFELLGRSYNELLTSAFTTGNANPSYLQNIYGDNSEVNVKAGTEVPDPTNPLAKSTTSVETKVPKRVVTGSSKDKDGNLVVKYMDYSTGTGVEGQQKVTYEQARTDFYSIGGKQYATKVEDKSSKWRKENGFNEGRPDIIEMNKKFQYGQQPPASGTKWVWKDGVLTAVNN